MAKRCLLTIVCILLLLNSGVLWAQQKQTEGPSSAATRKAAAPGVVGIKELAQALLGADIRTTTSANPQNETTIAGDPSNSLIVIGGFNDYRLGTGFGGNGVVFSADGGATSVDNGPAVALPAGFTNSGGDPSIAFNSSGRAYYAHIASAAGASIFTRNNGIFVSSSTNGGVTWSPTVGVATNIWPGFGTVPFEDKEMIAADEYPGSPFTDGVYVSWTRFYDGVHPANAVAGGGDIMFSSSSDNGATWSAPIIVSSPANEPANGGTGTNGTSFVQGSEPEVEADGDVYVVYWFGNRTNVSRSTDGGGSFGVATFPFGVPFAVSGVPSPLPSETFRVNPYPNIETDPTRPDHVYVVAADADGPTPLAQVGGGTRATDAGADIIFARSTDNGATWSPTLILNDDPAENNQIFPWMAVDQNTGDICVIWYDTRLDPVGADGIKDLDVFATISTDGGATWSPNVRVTDVSFDPNVGSVFAGATFFG